MTVYANKPEINVREKLKELDFKTIPYEKLPKGTVVDIQQARFDTRLQIDHAGTLQFTAFDTDVVIYPKSKNSKFYCTGHVYSGHGRNPNGGPAFGYFVNNGTRQFGPHDASNHTVNWFGNVNSFHSVDDLITSSFTTGANNWQYISESYHGTVIFEPNSTEKVTFQLGFHGLNSIDINRNHYGAGSNNYGSGWTTLTVMEIL